MQGRDNENNRGIELSERRNYKEEQAKIDAALELVAKEENRPLEVFSKLENALKIAISLNDNVRLVQVRDAIVEFGNRVGADDKPGLCVLVFDILIGVKGIEIPRSIENAIICDLEARLERWSNPTEERLLNPWAAEGAAKRLGKYYQSMKRTNDVRRVISKAAEAFKKMGANASAGLKSAWSQNLVHLYREFHLKEDADAMLREVRSMGPSSLSDLKRVEASTFVSDDQMNSFVAEILKGDFDDAVHRLIESFITKRAESERHLTDMGQMAPLSLMMRQMIVDHKGRAIGSVGSIQEDLEGHVVLEMAQRIGIQNIYLHEVLRKFFLKFSFDLSAWMTLMSKSGLFEDVKHAFLERGLHSYFKGDMFSAVHLLVPQIEDGIRNLIEKKGGIVLRPKEDGTFQLRVLDDLLRDKLLEEVFGSDVPLYLRVVLTDPRGLNIRNNICHGMSPAVVIDNLMADRIAHILLVLGTVRLDLGIHDAADSSMRK